jgi:hypothetical protein
MERSIPGHINGDTSESFARSRVEYNEKIGYEKDLDAGYGQLRKALSDPRRFDVDSIAVRTIREMTSSMQAEGLENAYQAALKVAGRDENSRYLVSNFYKDLKPVEKQVKRPTGISGADGMLFEVKMGTKKKTIKPARKEVEQLMAAYLMMAYQMSYPPEEREMFRKNPKNQELVTLEALNTYYQEKKMLPAFQQEIELKRIDSERMNLEDDITEEMHRSNRPVPYEDKEITVTDVTEANEVMEKIRREQFNLNATNKRIKEQGFTAKAFEGQKMDSHVRKYTESAKAIISKYQTKAVDPNLEESTASLMKSHITAVLERGTDYAMRELNKLKDSRQIPNPDAYEMAKKFKLELEESYFSTLRETKAVVVDAMAKNRVKDQWQDKGHSVTERSYVILKLIHDSLDPQMDQNEAFVNARSENKYGDKHLNAQILDFQLGMRKAKQNNEPVYNLIWRTVARAFSEGESQNAKDFIYTRYGENIDRLAQRLMERQDIPISLKEAFREIRDKRSQLFDRHVELEKQVVRNKQFSIQTYHKQMLEREKTKEKGQDPIEQRAMENVAKAMTANQPEQAPLQKPVRSEENKATRLLELVQNITKIDAAGFGDHTFTRTRISRLKEEFRKVYTQHMYILYGRRDMATSADQDPLKESEKLVRGHKIYAKISELVDKLPLEGKRINGAKLIKELSPIMEEMNAYAKKAEEDFEEINRTNISGRPKMEDLFHLLEKKAKNKGLSPEEYTKKTMQIPIPFPGTPFNNDIEGPR